MAEVVAYESDVPLRRTLGVCLSNATTVYNTHMYSHVHDLYMSRYTCTIMVHDDDCTCNYDVTMVTCGVDSLAWLGMGAIQ